MWGNSAKFWNAMPMPRASGGAHVTSRHCRRMVPASRSSTPATRRNRTVFPAPEGPNITTICPVSADSETSSRILLVLKPLETRSISICAMDSAFHGAERQSLDQIALRPEGDRQGWGDRQHYRGGDLAILNARGRDEGERAHGHWLLVGGRQDQREDEIVPTKDEREKPRRRNARSRERHCDAREGPDPGMARDPIGRFDVRGNILEITAYYPENQRQRDQLIDPDQADVGVGQSNLLIVERERQQHEQRRGEAERQQREGDILAEAKLVPRERVGRRHAQDQRETDRNRRQQHAVPEILHEGDVDVARRRLQLSRDQRLIVGEGRLEEEARRYPQDVFVRLERHQEDPEDREQEEDQDRADRDGPQGSFERGCVVHRRLPLRQAARAFA